MLASYVGVTGFMSSDEVKQVHSVVPSNSIRQLMVGVLASSKTINGIPNKWPNRYPAANKIADIFLRHPKLTNLIHFNTKEPEKLLEQMEQVTQLGGPNLHGLQLNIKWPEAEILKKYKELHPGKIIVLQCGSGALEDVRYDPMLLAKRLNQYDENCDYVLLDPSGGLGQDFDPEQIFNLTRELYFRFGRYRMGFGIAGGLCAETLKNIPYNILQFFPWTNIDAEGKLRDESDNLDIAKAQKYVEEAFAMFSVYER